MRKEETFYLLNMVLPCVENCSLEHFTNAKEKDKLIEYLRVQRAMHMPIQKREKRIKSHTIDKEVIRSMLGIQEVLTINDFAICFEIPLSVFSSPCRKREFVEARMISMAYMYGQGYTYKYIGVVHGKTHATIMHGVQTAKRLIEVRDKRILCLIDKLRNKYH